MPVREQPFTGNPDDLSGDQLLEDAFRQIGLDTPTDPVEPSEPEPGTPTPDEPTEPVEPPTASSDEWSWEDGFKVTRDEARRLAEFERYLLEDPRFVEMLNAVTRGEQPAPTTTPAQPEPLPAFTLPDGFTLDDLDPATRAILTHVQTLSEQNRALEQRLSQSEQAITQQSTLSTQSLIERAKRDFAKQHSLNDAMMNRVHDIASTTINLSGFTTGINPLDGKPQRPDPLAALEAAYTMVLSSLPDTRDRLVDEAKSRAAEEMKRRQKASSLAGSSGVTSRTPPPPSNEVERMAQLKAAIAQEMFGQAPTE